MDGGWLCSGCRSANAGSAPVCSSCGQVRSVDDVTSFTAVRDRTGSTSFEPPAPSEPAPSPASGSARTGSLVLGLLVGAIAVMAGVAVAVLVRARVPDPAPSEPPVAAATVPESPAPTTTTTTTSTSTTTTVITVVVPPAASPSASTEPAAPQPSVLDTALHQMPINRDGTHAYGIPAGGAPLKRGPQVAAEDIVVIPAGESVVAQCHFENGIEPPYPDFEYPDLVNRWWVFTSYRGIDGWVPDGRVATEGDARNFTNIPPCF